jgi:ribonuclease HI
MRQRIQGFVFGVLVTAAAGLGAQSVVPGSRYVIDGASRWMANWKPCGWLTRAQQPVRNRDLWEQLDALAQQRLVAWSWVRGHTGSIHNERCDVLACDVLAAQACADVSRGASA